MTAIHVVYHCYQPIYHACSQTLFGASEPVQNHWALVYNDQVKLQSISMQFYTGCCFPLVAPFRIINISLQTKYVLTCILVQIPRIIFTVFVKTSKTQTVLVFRWYTESSSYRYIDHVLCFILIRLIDPYMQLAIV